jgi:hypothetical protein
VTCTPSPSWWSWRWKDCWTSKHVALEVKRLLNMQTCNFGRAVQCHNMHQKSSGATNRALQSNRKCLTKRNTNNCIAKLAEHSVQRQHTHSDVWTCKTIISKLLNKCTYFVNFMPKRKWSSISPPKRRSKSGFCAMLWLLHFVFWLSKLVFK